jgi:ferredoxin-NADP reductase
VPGWPGHLAGQHVDVRLTAPDGYSAVRSYSIASPPSEGARIELTVERLNDGEVSPYLTQELMTGDKLELRGPIGGWFVWRAQQQSPVQLIAGGSGIVPLMAMIRTRNAAGNTTPFRLLYSVRTPEAVLYHSDLDAARTAGVEITFAYTRATPPDWPSPPRRVDAAALAQAAWPASSTPDCYVCGPTPFVERIAALLTAANYEAGRIRTERFGATGESR